MEIEIDEVQIERKVKDFFRKKFLELPVGGTLYIYKKQNMWKVGETSFFALFRFWEMLREVGFREVGHDNQDNKYLYRIKAVKTGGNSELDEDWHK